MRPFPVREGSLVFWKEQDIRGIVIEVPRTETLVQRDAALRRGEMVLIWWDVCQVGNWAMLNIERAIRREELEVQVF